MKTFRQKTADIKQWSDRYVVARICAYIALFFIFVFALVGAWSVLERLFPTLSFTPAALISIEEDIPWENATTTPPSETDQEETEHPSPQITRTAGERTTETFRVHIGSVPGDSTGSVTIPPLRPGETRTDMAVAIHATGIIDSGGTFIETDTIRGSDTFAIRFAVFNIGARASGPWEYYAFLPVQFGGGNNVYIYRSGQQPSLLPGEQKVYVLTTTKLKVGKQKVEILLDPGSRLSEITRDNNRDSRILNVPLD